MRGEVLRGERFSLMREKGGDGDRQVGVQPGAEQGGAYDVCDFCRGRQPGSGLVA